MRLLIIRVFFFHIRTWTAIQTSNQTMAAAAMPCHITTGHEALGTGFAERSVMDFRTISSN
jgi:hypothetical protein